MPSSEMRVTLLLAVLIVIWCGAEADSRLPILKGRVYTTIPKVSKSWAVVFYVYPKKKTECMTNLLHYTTGTDTGPATRVPGVWLYPKTTALYICSPINGKRFCFKTPNQLALRRWHHVVIEQVHETHKTWLLKVMVDGQLILSKKNMKPQEYRNVKGYISDAWFPPSKAYIKRVVHENLEKGYMIEKGNLITTVNGVGKGWEISFDVKLLAKTETITNILHATNGSSRVVLPGVFVLPDSTKLKICSNLNGKSSSCFNTAPLVLNSFTNIKIRQFHYNRQTYRYQIFLNNRQVYSIDNRRAINSGNVKVYVSNPWQNEAIGHISGVNFKKISEGRLILQSNLIDTISKLTKSWRLEFEIKPIATSRLRTSVIHLTRGSRGERVPAVYFEPGTFKLSVCSDINGNKLHCFKRVSLPKNVFTKVIITQIYTGPKSHRYSIYYGGRVVYTTINRKAKSFANVKVYNGDKFYPPAKALFKGYTFQNYEVDGDWGSWTDYAACSKTCGAGSQTRRRTCNNPSPRYGGKPCLGSSVSTKHCNLRPCPINGGWSNWGSYGSCSKLCGLGTQKRTRTCTKPTPKHGGRVCTGSKVSQRNCKIKECPINGGWSNWGSYGSCSKLCGLGTQKRTRTCTKPTPKHGGRVCTGSKVSQRNCKIKECPINGGWSNWGSYGSCSKLCGLGTQKRTRTCTKPTPKHGGRVCTGSKISQRNCKIKECPTCKSGWRHWSVNGMCYGYGKRQLSWHNAENFCRSKGGHLASIHSAAENTFVYGTYPGHQNVWIGMTDRAREGHWKWNDGTSTDYTNFRRGEPNNDHGGEDCMSFWGDSSRKWNDAQCRLSFNFVCKATRENNKPI